MKHSADMFAEAQTIAAVFDLLKLSWNAAVFLKKVKDADKIAAEVYDRVERLQQVLEGVRAVLQKRANRLDGDSAASKDQDESVEKKIEDSLRACNACLLNLENRLGGFGTSESSTAALVARFKIAFKHASIAKRQTDLEARISILQTNLVVLQLFDQAQTHSVIGVNHSEVLQILDSLGKQVQHGNGLLKSMLLGEQHAAIPHSDAVPISSSVDTRDTAANNDTVSSLAECIRAAEDVYDRYTERSIGNKSVRDMERELAGSPPLSPTGSGTPNPEPASPSPAATDIVERSSRSPHVPETPMEEETYPLPLRFLDRYIIDHRKRASTEIEKAHFNLAETSLDLAARYSVAREKQYNVPFADKVQLIEEMAFVYLKQAKWAEAVGRLHGLLRDSSHGDGEQQLLANARQNQLLAAVYYDRHHKSTSGGLRSGAGDLEMAEKYAHIAFARRDGILETSGRTADVSQEHEECMQLLVNILAARGKLVESRVFQEMLTEGLSATGESVKRTSTLASQPAVTDFEIVDDPHEALISAITSGDNEHISNTASFHNLNVEKVCGRGEGKTLLMHAVECSDESTIHRLLDPVVGASIDTRNRKGRTALHLAAAQGRREIARCLLHHDADMEVKDNDGETPLVKAVQGDHRDIVQDFFDKGANMLTKNLGRLDEWGALHHAVQLETPRMASLLLDLVPDLKDSVDQAGKTALHHCAEDADQKRLQAAKKLLEHKHHVDVNAVDTASRSALYFAASKPFTAQREAMVELLIRHGARLDEARLPLRVLDYAALRSVVKPRRTSTRTRHDSVSTNGSVGTDSTGATRISRILSGQMFRSPGS